jgi:hypothetical protein
MTKFGKSYDYLPRKGQTVATSLICKPEIVPVTEEFILNRRTNYGSFVCFAIFQDGEEEVELWFVMHDGGEIAAYYPFEVTINGR